MSKEDNRFSHSLEFVKRNILGAFEASKSCCQIPGKPHLYHVEFLKRENFDIENNPIDYALEAHFSPCEEVSWYLHRREKLLGELPTEEPDDDYVQANAEGLLPELLVFDAMVAKAMIERRRSLCRTDVLPELSFKGTIEVERFHDMDKEV